jgi:hypothetical protein
MKKNDHSSSTKAQKNETKNKPDQKANKKTSNKTNEDLGTMKIGKAHSINDDREPATTKERRK